MFHPISPTCPRSTSREQLARSLGTLFATYLCTPYFPRLGAFAISSHPGVRGFPTFGLLRPIRHSSQASGFRPGSPPSSCPPPFASCEKLPVFGVEDSNGMMEVACCWLPHPLSAASQSAYRVGQVSLYGHRSATHCAGPYSCVVPTISGLTGWHLRQGMPGAPFPVGLCTLQVIHHVIPQPSTTSWGLVSPSWRLSGACCSR